MQHIAFYRFVYLQDPLAVVQRLHDLARHLTGSILVADEGINGVLAGEADYLDTFQAQLQEDERFQGMRFNRSACTTAPFAKLKIHHKQAILAFGAQESAADPRAVSPQEWRILMQRKDVVVLDNRNSFEYRLGRFKNAIDPQVSHFKDFSQYVEANAEQWMREGKQVAMYCTGGIRCEKASHWMQSLGLKVAQLEGGILNYFAQMPDAEQDFEGECFVFDNRIALDTTLQETSTTEAEVYDPRLDGQWRIDRAKRLAQAL